MNEKQRWLLRDLEEWRDKQMARIGKYGPNKPPQEPAEVKAARRAYEQASKVIRRWDNKEKKAPWDAQKRSIDARVQTVKRAILFEKTAEALKAIKALK